jgi:hypothetical protein
MRERVRPLAAVAYLVLVPQLAFASGPETEIAGEPDVAPEPAAAAPAPQWRFSLLPYYWASGLNGTIRPYSSAPTLKLDSSISDTLDSRDSALFLGFGAERGRFVVIGDINRIVSTQSGTIAGGIPAEGELDQLSLTLAAGYRAILHPTGYVDVFGGIRAYDFSVDLSAAGGAITASESISFVDPIVGARVVQAFSPRLSVALAGDIGGFGVGNEFAALLTGLVNYRITDSTTISGGWRQMWIDYDDGSTVVDVSVGGPMIGVGFRF